VCSAVRPVLSCGGLRCGLRWSAVVCGFQTYPFSIDGVTTTVISAVS